jgi:molecular chaperone DnaK
MPMIKRRVREMIGKEPEKNINPDEAVALGAAIQGGIISGNVKDLVLLDVTPISLGIEVKGGLFERLIPQDTTIPTKEAKVFTTAADNQTSVSVRVFQGEREIAEENEFLDEFELTGIPPAPKGEPKIKVEFNIDSNGIVNVTARDEASGQQQKVTVEGGVGMSDDKIEDLRNEAEQYAQQDQERRRLIEQRNDLESLAHSAENILQQRGDELDETLKSDTEIILDEVDTAIADDDVSIDRLEELEDDLRHIMGNYPEDIMEETDGVAMPFGSTMVEDDESEDSVDVEVTPEDGW